MPFKDFRIHPHDDEHEAKCNKSSLLCDDDDNSSQNTICNSVWILLLLMLAVCSSLKYNLQSLWSCLKCCILPLILNSEKLNCSRKKELKLAKLLCCFLLQNRISYKEILDHKSRLLDFALKSSKKMFFETFSAYFLCYFQWLCIV